jgi:hypothetical protein
MDGAADSIVGREIPVCAQNFSLAYSDSSILDSNMGLFFLNLVPIAFSDYMCRIDPILGGDA